MFPYEPDPTPVQFYRDNLRGASNAALVLVSILGWSSTKRWAAHEILAYRLCQELGL